MKKPSWTARIAKARKAKGLTQQALADAIGVHYVTMSKIENAKADVTIDQVIQISEVLGISAYDLFSSSPHSSVLNLGGFVNSRGSITKNDKNVELTVVNFSDPFSSKEFTWFEIRTSDFFPMLHEGDRIRTSVIPKEDIELYVDRLCVFEVINDPQTSVLALMGYGRSTSDLVPKAMNGRVIATEGTRVTRWVSLILPSPIGETAVHLSD